MEIKRIHVDGKNYSVTTERFDEDIDSASGAKYHGHHYRIEGDGVDLSFKKYDDDNEVGYISNREIEPKLANTLIKLLTGDSTVMTHSLGN